MCIAIKTYFKHTCYKCLIIRFEVGQIESQATLGNTIFFGLEQRIQILIDISKAAL